MAYFALDLNINMRKSSNLEQCYERFNNNLPPEL